MSSFSTSQVSTCSSASSSLAFLNLRYEVTSYSEYGWPKKALLRRLNGSFTTGALNGLMGPSGSGKTTLLSILSGKNTQRLNPNSALYIGKTTTTSFYFVQQHILETIEGTLTVRQILEYAYQFKNGLGQKAKMEDHITQITSKLLLNNATLFDQPFSHCSGGEQRRVSVAQELMTLKPPSFLLLDEPTTGLDSYAALELIKCLSELARSCKSNINQTQLTIIASIHAPSNELLLHFSKLYVLAKGVCIFSGPPQQLKCVLKEVAGVTLENKSEQPIEALIKIACNDLNGSEQLQTLAKYTLESEYKAISAEKTTNFLQPLPPSSGLPNNPKAFSLVDLYLLICRQTRITFIAKSSELACQLISILGVILVFSTIFSSPAMVLPSGCYTKSINSTFDLEPTLNSNDGFCKASPLRDYFITENINFQSLNRDQNILFVMLICSVLFGRLVGVFRSEHRNRWYSVSVFYWAADFVCSLQTTLFALAISVFAYFIVSEHAIDNYEINWTRLGHFIACTTLYLAHTQALGQFSGVLFAGNPVMIISLSTLSITVHFLLNDFFFKSAEVPIAAYRLLSEVLGMKHITRYLVYVFYGVDRCGEGEGSWILQKYDVDVEQLWFDLLWVVLLKILLIKVATFALIFLRYGSIGLWSWKLSKTANFKHSSSKSLIEIDFLPVKRDSKIDLFCSDAKVTCEPNTLMNSNKTFAQTAISWRNLTLLKKQPLFQMKSFYPSKNLKEKQIHFSSPKTILHNLNGSFTFGSLNAILGMSGAGKTTLLRLLNGQQHQRLTEESKLYINNQVPLSTVFIAQEVSTHLMRGLTAKHLLIYASKLKNAKHKMNKIDHEKIAIGLLEELNLVDTADTKVEHLSGGEQKRLALALELTSIVMPNLVCIDEPTSGLDSNSAVLVISTLLTLSRSHPISIVISIHQPSSQLLRLFDSLYVLAAGGHAIYSGPPEGIERHLAQIQETSFIKNECLKYPIETLIKFSSFKAETNAVVRQLEAITRLKTRTKDKANDLLQNTFLLENPSALTNRVRFSVTSVFLLTSRYLAYMAGYQWKELLGISFLYIIYVLNLRLFFDPNIASVSGCISYEAEDIGNATLGGSGSGCSAGVKAQVAAEGFLLLNVVYTYFFGGFLLIIALMQTPLCLLYELPLFYNEHRNGWYSPLSWYFCRLLFDLLPLIPVSALYVYIGDIWEGVRSVENEGSLYWSIFGVLFLSVATGQGYAYMILLATDGHFINSIILGLAGLLPMFYLSNIFARLALAHYVQQMLSYLSITRWSMQALMLLQYGFGRCKEREVQPLLYWMDLVDEDYNQAILWMFIHLIFYRGIALWMLVRKVNPQSDLRRKINKTECASAEDDHHGV